MEYLIRIGNLDSKDHPAELLIHRVEEKRNDDIQSIGAAQSFDPISFDMQDI